MAKSLAEDHVDGITQNIFLVSYSVSFTILFTLIVATVTDITVATLKELPLSLQQLNNAYISRMDVSKQCDNIGEGYV